MDSSHDLLILYASQTGTSQYLSETLFRDCFKHNLIPQLLSLDQYSISSLPSEKYIIFIISTTGQGEPPSSMIAFWRFLLLKDLPNDVLNNVNFTIFGLGDRVYQQFNAMARKLFQRLLQLGAKCFHERGLGDDSNPLGYYAEYEPWNEGLWKSLQNHFPNKKVLLSEEELMKLEQEIEKPRYIVKMIDEFDETKSENIVFIKNQKVALKTAEQFLQKPSNCVKYDCCLGNDAKMIKLLKKTQLTSEDSDKTVLKLDFETPKCLIYSPGDIACIQPTNDPVLCKKLADLLKVNIRNDIKIQPNPYYNGQIKKDLPDIITIQDLFEKFLDIAGTPTRYFFHIMSYFTDDELHQEKLAEMGSGKKAENIEDYYNYCIREKRNVYEILFDFKSVNLPLEYLIESVNFIKPREYSISSSLKKQANQMSLTVALVEYKTAFNRQIEGLCSKYFKSKNNSQKVLMWLKKGSLIFPSNIDDPIILVGPGTGISPFISFLEDREMQIEAELKENKGRYINPLNTIVIFGCRYQKKDYLYRDYLENLEKKKFIRVITAFSRDQEIKSYVQHEIKKNSKELAEIIDKNSEIIKIFISGNAKFMPQQVKDAFVDIMSERFEDEAKGRVSINILQKKQQFMIEAW